MHHAQYEDGVQGLGTLSGRHHETPRERGQTGVVIRAASQADDHRTQHDCHHDDTTTTASYVHRHQKIVESPRQTSQRGREERRVDAGRAQFPRQSDQLLHDAGHRSGDTMSGGRPVGLGLVERVSCRRRWVVVFVVTLT